MPSQAVPSRHPTIPRMITKTITPQHNTIRYTAYSHPPIFIATIRYLQYALILLSFINCFLSFEPLFSHDGSHGALADAHNATNIAPTFDLQAILQSHHNIAQHHTTTNSNHTNISNTPNINNLFNYSTIQEQFQNVVINKIITISYYFSLFVIKWCYFFINTTPLLNGVKKYVLYINYTRYVYYFVALFALTALRKSVFFKEEVVLDFDQNVVQYSLQSDTGALVYPLFHESLYTEDVGEKDGDEEKNAMTCDEPTSEKATKTKEVTNPSTQKGAQTTPTVGTTTNIKFFMHQYINLYKVSYVMCLANNNTLHFPSLSHSLPQLKTLLNTLNFDHTTAEQEKQKLQQQQQQQQQQKQQDHQYEKKNNNTHKNSTPTTNHTPSNVRSFDTNGTRRMLEKCLDYCEDSDHQGAKRPNILDEFKSQEHLYIYPIFLHHNLSGQQVQALLGDISYHIELNKKKTK